MTYSAVQLHFFFYAGPRGGPVAGLIRIAAKENKEKINNENTRNEKGRTRGRGGVGWQESARQSQTEPAPDPEESFRSKQESARLSQTEPD